MRFLLLLVVFGTAPFAWAVDPSENLATYYANIDGKSSNSSDDLRKALCTIISSPYTTIAYASLKDQVYAASSDPSDFYIGTNKTMEDIYSSCTYTASNAGSSATACGQGWNKEHTVPQSYFNKAAPMVSDAHHIFPTDIKMNSTRSNYPYGENNAAKTCNQGYGHLGTSTFAGYTGTVFDPGTTGDGAVKGNYRGDIARAYFYMVTRYRTTNFTQDNANNGAVSFTYSGGVADLTDYMKNLMLKWHREDPVSEKELIRNNAIYAHQKNRNPFVDYPCLVEYIWGEHKGEAVSLSSLISGYASPGTNCCAASTDPTLTVTPATLTMDPAAVNGSSTKTFTVTGANLTGGITISISGSYYSVSPTTIASGSANGTHTITVTYHPTAAGTHNATVTVSSTGAANQTVSVTGTCTTVYTATWMANGSQYHQNTAASGTAPSVPEAPDDCSSTRKFIGWTDNGSYNGNGTGLFTNEAPTMTTDKVFYAVYADMTSGGTSTATFDASDITATPENGTITWTHTASGITLTLSAGQRYTSGTPNTFTVTKGTSNYAQLSGEKTITQVVATISGANYKINSATPGSLTTSGTTQTISNINSTSVKMNATSSNQIRLSKLVVTYSSTSYTNYSTVCSSAVTNVTLSFNANGGGGTMSSQSIPSGVATAINSCTFTAPVNKSFAGWAESASGDVVYADGANITITANKTLYAKWADTPTPPAPSNWWPSSVEKPIIDARLRIVGQNAENYYNNINNSYSKCKTEAELVAKTKKMAHVFLELNADIVALCEVEDCDTILGRLVKQMNEFYGSNVYTYIRDNVTTTYTKACFVYRKDKVEPYGQTYSCSTENIWKQRLRFQTFTEKTTGEKFTLSMNHFKAKVNSSDKGAAQRIQNANDVMSALNSNAQDPDILIMGDLNAYTNEDGAALLISNGYAEQLVRFDANAYTYIYNNQQGLLDHAMANSTMATTVVNARAYHINTAGPDSCKFSDHDGYVVGVNLPSSGGEQYMVTFMNNGATHATKTGTAGAAIADITAPTPCDGYTFEGWSTHEYAANNTTSPDIDYTGSFPNTNTTYYAVYSKTEGSGGGSPVLTNNYKKVTNTSELTDCNYMIVSGFKAMSTAWKNTYYLAPVDVTVTNDVISTTDATIIWGVTVDGDNISFSNASSGNLYIAQSGKYYNLKLGNNTTDNKFTYSVSDGAWTIKSVTYNDRVLQYHSAKDQFSYYTSGTVELYKQQTSGGSSTTYHTTAPNCCTATITATTDDDTKGTAGVTLP